MVETLSYLFGREGTVMTTAIALSFFLSLFPVIVLVLGISAEVGLRGFREVAFTALEGLFPVSQEFIVRNLRIYTRGVGGTQLVSLLLSAAAGTTFFFALEAGLDSAFRLSHPRRFLRSQALGTVMTVMAGGLMFASVYLVEWFSRVVASGPAMRTVQIVGVHLISYSVAFLLFLAVLILLPSRRRHWRAVLGAAVFAALLWLAVDVFFRWAAGSWALQAIYGPFFVSVTLLLWAFAMACILLGSARLAADGFFG